MSHNVDMIVCPQEETGPGNKRNGEGSVIELKDGRLFLAYTHFYAGSEDLDPSDIHGKISSDGGRTWSEPFLIQPNTARYTTGHLSLVRLKPFQDPHWQHEDDIALIFLEVNTCYEDSVVFKLSHDESQSWSRDVQINQTGTMGHMDLLSDSALVLSSGRILVPVSPQLGGRFCHS